VRGLYSEAQRQSQKQCETVPGPHCVALGRVYGGYYCLGDAASSDANNKNESRQQPKHLSRRLSRERICLFGGGVCVDIVTDKVPCPGHVQLSHNVRLLQPAEDLVI
jgi:hypothetical protein